MISVFISPRYLIDKDELIKKVTKILKSSDVDAALQLNIAFVGKRKMKQIAMTYKNEDVALPVLSFPYLSAGDSQTPEFTEEKMFGEIVLCFPQAVLLAAEKNKPLDSMILNLIEHGIRTILHHK
ncbi:MAG: rRNA maturation RNase YbeY [Candidatus Roizmanbacteria bacterium]